MMMMIMIIIIIIIIMPRSIESSAVTSTDSAL